jgi:hypothetical protein
VHSVRFQVTASPYGPGNYTQFDTPHSVRLLWASDQLDAALTTHNTLKTQTSMNPVGFESTTPASKRPQTNALDRAATVVINFVYSHIYCGLRLRSSGMLRRVASCIRAHVSDVSIFKIRFLRFAWICPSALRNDPLPTMQGVIKKKSVPLQAWSGPESSRKLRFPDVMTKAQDGGKVVGLTHRPPLPPGNTPGTYFC